MAVVYFSLGANIGDKRNNMITAVALLSERVGSILALSDLYETTPWGFVSENNFKRISKEQVKTNANELMSFRTYYEAVSNDTLSNVTILSKET